MQKQPAVVVVLGTGGTIAGTSAPGTDERLYQAAQLSVEQLLQAVPGLVPPVECEQVAQLDSKDMSSAVWLRLARRVAFHLTRPEVAGIVVTHGTDTLEETAWFLQQVLAPARPVVLTAAMRPATAAEPDGPANLRDAVQVAHDAEAHGVLAVMAGRVFAARDVRKAHTQRVDAFDGGDAGPLATVSGPEVAWHRPPPRDTAWGLDRLPADTAAWPRVDLLSSHAGVDGRVVAALRATGARGLVAVGTGNGTLHADLDAALQDAVAAGVVVWRASRCGAGPVTDRPGDFPGAGDLTPAKARITLMLALASGLTPPSA